MTGGAFISMGAGGLGPVLAPMPSVLGESVSGINWPQMNIRAISIKGRPYVWVCDHIRLSSLYFLKFMACCETDKIIMAKIMITNEKNEWLLNSFDFVLLLPILCHCCYQMTQFLKHSI